MVISEIIEERSEEELSDDRYEIEYDYECVIINPEAQKERIRKILEHQKSVYRSSSSSSSSSTSCSSSFSSSGRSRGTLLDHMRVGSTSLRRLFDMERLSLADHFGEYSGTPVIKSVPLWGSDSDGEAHQDPWAFLRREAGEFGKAEGEDESNASQRDRSSRDSERDVVRPQDRTEKKVEKEGTRSNRRLTRKRSFRQLPGFSFGRWRGFRFRLKLRRRLGIMICGRKFR